jgi:hypothetical protein
MDKKEIIKILIQENENKNEFLVMFSQTKDIFLKEKLQEINKEIEPIAIKIAEEYINQNKKEEKKIMMMMIKKNIIILIYLLMKK